MTERRLPPALEEKVHPYPAPTVDKADLLDWLYGKPGKVLNYGFREPATPGLVGRVQVRAADLFAGWKDRGEEDISLAWGLALRVELEGSYIEALRAELGEES